MKQFFKEYFNFNRRERNGILILCAIIFVLIIFNWFVIPNLPNDKVYDTSAFEREVDNFLIEQKRHEDSLKTKYAKPAYKKYEKKAIPKGTLFEFNPNTATNEEWERLGLSEKQVRIIHNFTSKGGKFYKKEDLQKIYGINPALYKRIEPYILIDETVQRKKPHSKSINPLLEINSSDSASLDSLKGIGPSYASRIIKYRNRLGGFSNKEQLNEVFGLTPAARELLNSQIFVDGSLIHKININTATVNELKSHPYFTWGVANSIIAIRTKHGRYNSIDEIRKSDLVDEELYRKLAPYLTIE